MTFEEAAIAKRNLEAIRSRHVLFYDKIVEYEKLLYRAEETFRRLIEQHEKEAAKRAEQKKGERE